MKKALALVLALVLALSMAVSAFAVELVDLTKVPTATVEKTAIGVINPFENDVDTVLYTDAKGVYYIAIDEAYTDVKLTANGNVSAELVKYDPALMNVSGLEFAFAITCKGEATGEEFAVADGDVSTDVYAAALERVAELNEGEKVTYYGLAVPALNIIKVSVADNYGIAYTEGTLKIEAKLDKVAYSTVLTVINDVTIFEYEEVKWTAANNADGAALECGAGGYSDYMAENEGYGDEYVPENLRKDDDAAVISTTAFRAIAGKAIAVNCDEMLVNISAVAAAQKGVNFKHEGLAVVDANKDGKAEAITFGWLGKQVIASDFTITVDTDYTYYTLREEFGYAVEDKDIVTYYVLKDGKVEQEIVVDYMTANAGKEVVLVLEGKAGETLGEYEIRLDVPTAAGSEQNPNTGAESVVGVVAALAVVSVATAAAVSLKK